MRVLLRPVGGADERPSQGHFSGLLTLATQSVVPGPGASVSPGSWTALLSRAPGGLCILTACARESGTSRPPPGNT